MLNGGRILLGPGPSIIPERVLKAMAKPVLGHLDPDFIAMMDEMKALLRYTFQTENNVTFAISGPGSAAMEMSLVNMIEPGEKAIVCSNGYFGERMRGMIVRNGSIPVDVKAEEGQPIDPVKLDKALSEHPDISVVTMVYAETSTGVQSNLKELSDVVHAHNAICVVDMVPALGGSVIKTDEWKIDVAYAGSQKCLSCTPGVSPITFSDRALEKILSRKKPVSSWFYDLKMIVDYWGSGQKRAYHHTAPINSLYALHEALTIIKEEGIENRWERHKKVQNYAQDKFEALGLRNIVEQEYRMPQLHAVEIPQGVDDFECRKRLIKEFNIELGAGLGDRLGKVWRIGFMGEAAQTTYVDYCVDALKKVL
jgi:alanine-glyoxylate transaminase/serine-glyoxylate transaminase/serine-pyruvate transaminase